MVMLPVTLFAESMARVVEVTVPRLVMTTPAPVAFAVPVTRGYR